MVETIKKTPLNDGRELVIRQPKGEEDLKKLVRFLSGLPADLRNTLRYNVADQETCRFRLGQLDDKNHWRLIAELNGVIVGDATMDREPFAWTRHVAQLRCVVEPGFQQFGVGQVLFDELVGLGPDAGIERLYTEVMAEQTDLIVMLEKSGFSFEARRNKYAKDPSGKLHDLIIMSNDLDSVWKRLDEQLVEMDIRIYSSGF